MTVCYDLRFAHLYRTLAQAGASILTVPSAFTVPTGRAHWHVLLRARAIETGCFVIAPAQCGTHDAGRTTYGHSLIVSPWGEILADGGEEPGIVTARLDLGEIERRAAWCRRSGTTAASRHLLSRVSAFQVPVKSLMTCRSRSISIGFCNTTSRSSVETPCSSFSDI